MNNRIFHRLIYDLAWTDPDGEKRWHVRCLNSPNFDVHSRRVQEAKSKEEVGLARNIKVQVIKEIVLSEAEVQS